MNTTLEMVASAEALIVQNEQQQRDLDTQLQTLKDQLTHLQRQGQERARASIHHEEILQSALEDLQQAEGYARLAKGTPKEQPAIRAAAQQRKLYQAAQKDYEQKKAEKDQADRSDQARELELGEMIRDTQRQLDQVRADHGQIHKGHAQVHGELGTAKYQAFMSAYQAKQQEIERLQSELLTAQMDAHDLYSEACEDMRAWPDYHRAVLELEDIDDPTMTMLKVAHLYMHTILTDHDQVRRDVKLRLSTGNNQTGIATPWEKVIVHDSVLYSVLRDFTGNEHELRQRVQQLQTMIDAYRTYARNEAAS